ncbi:LysE family translocator [Lysobacter sp. CA199]|uniref:LysE family translocator n=1 Tax=Lysobacter sp. CA199 TaxID=3455608 RepID=UPI003F8D3857
MPLSLILSMAAFALAASITPGPVNVVALSAGARHGLRASAAHVTGATAGFCLLLLLVGLGLHELLHRAPWIARAIQWSGVAFLLFMAWKLARDDGRIDTEGASRAPTLLSGAIMQWLNPKAWMAAVAGTGVYAADGDVARVWWFAAIYFAICYLSVGAWAYAGAALRGHLRDARRMRWFNRSMAALLAASAAWLLIA